MISYVIEFFANVVKVKLEELSTTGMHEQVMKIHHEYSNKLIVKVAYFRASLLVQMITACKLC